jgi:tripartite-type tricarboxylate transporter receptor subunit TctC
MKRLQNVASVLSCLTVVALSLSGSPLAQSYPGKTIKVISPWAAGGAADSIIRPVAQKLSALWGHAIVVENQAGASGTIGTSNVAKAAPDGYTWLLCSLGPIAISPALQPRLPYDSLKDFEPITQLVSSPQVVVARQNLPIQDMRALIAFARTHPQKLSYGSNGAGSTTHLGMEMLAQLGGIQMLHIPYKGGAQVMSDLLGGQIDLAILNIAQVLPLLEASKVRALAVSTARRASTLPNMPVVGETLPGYDLNSWWGLSAPAGTPKDVIRRIHAETTKIMRSPEIEQRMKDAGLEVEASTPEQFSALIKRDLAAWAEIIKRGGIKSAE